MNGKHIVRIAAAGVVAAAGLAALGVLPAKDALAGLLGAVQAAGPWGPVLLAARYVAACLLAVPGAMLTLAAGFLFGLAWGALAASAGSVVGATAAMLAGRTLLRRGVAKRIDRYPRFRAVDEAVARNGFNIVLLLRLSPLFPFNLLNYALGLTSVRLRAYVLASWLGMLPGTVMYVYFGSALRSLADAAAGRAHGGAAEASFFGAGLVMALVATLVVARAAARELRRTGLSGGEPAAAAGDQAARPATSLLGS